MFYINLHPTMYLLICYIFFYKALCHLHLHPTMYLLIPSSIAYDVSSAYTFTSHYVSINSSGIKISPVLHHNLHPTMYLLILQTRVLPDTATSIYIPLCIY